MIRYECPNGHAFASEQTVQCDQCDATVTVVPLARLIDSGGEIERLCQENGELRKIIAMQDQALRDVSIASGNADAAIRRTTARTILATNGLLTTLGLDPAKLTAP